jgi:hypothetical protein
MSRRAPQELPGGQSFEPARCAGQTTLKNEEKTQRVRPGDDSGRHQSLVNDATARSGPDGLKKPTKITVRTGAVR